MRFLALVLLCCNSWYSYAFNNIDGHVDNSHEEMLSGIYIDRVESIKDVKTMTYYFSENPSKVLVDTFLVFSNMVGKNNGAVIFTENKNIKYGLKQRQDNILKFKRASKCDFGTDSSDYIVFEDIDSSKCFFFLIDGGSGRLSDMLNVIYSNTKTLRKEGYSSLDKEYIKNFLLKGIDFDNYNKTKESVYRFVEYLMASLFNIN